MGIKFLVSSPVLENNEREKQIDIKNRIILVALYQLATNVAKKEDIAKIVKIFNSSSLEKVVPLRKICQSPGIFSFAIFQLFE